MVVESEVLKAENCALSKLSSPVHSNVSSLRFLLSETQFTADITTKVRKYGGTKGNAFFAPPPPPKLILVRIYRQKCGYSELFAPLSF